MGITAQQFAAELEAAGCRIIWDSMFPTTYFSAVRLGENGRPRYAVDMKFLPVETGAGFANARTDAWTWLDDLDAVRRYLKVETPKGVVLKRPTHDIDNCQIEDCAECEQAICQRCGQFKTNDPSPIVGDDLCGGCRERTDREDETGEHG
jgi:hypothetical protein